MQPPVSGPELAAMMKIGARVVRGVDWKWGDQVLRGRFSGGSHALTAALAHLRPACRQWVGTRMSNDPASGCVQWTMTGSSMNSDNWSNVPCRALRSLRSARRGGCFQGRSGLAQTELQPRVSRRAGLVAPMGDPSIVPRPLRAAATRPQALSSGLQRLLGVVTFPFLLTARGSPGRGHGAGACVTAVTAG